ncbi:MAG: MFS transporter, partial [Saprospiraceae bacterium]|nr:MFS transporter [Saprospiraceae bacterium]
VGRAFLGGAVAFSMTGATALVGDYMEGEERANFLGIQGAFMAFGGTIFVTLSGLLADSSWRYPFGVYLSAIVVLFLSAKVLFEPPKEENAQASTLHQGIPWRTLWPVYLTVFLGMVLFYVIPVQSPFLMRSLGAQQGITISAGLIGGTFMAATASFFYNKLKARLLFNQIYFILFLLMGGGYLLISYSPTVATAALSTALAGLGAGLIIPNTSLCLLTQSSPQNRGRIMSGMTGAVFLGQFFSPVAFQPLLTFSNLQQAHMLAACFAFGIALIYLVGFRKKYP